MEDGLVPDMDGSDNMADYVLILVVMEDGLVHCVNEVFDCI